MMMVLSNLGETSFRVVTKILSCRVNTTSGREIKQPGISFGSIFLPFSNESSRDPGTTFIVAGGNPLPPALNFPWKQILLNIKTLRHKLFGTERGLLKWTTACPKEMEEKENKDNLSAHQRVGEGGYNYSIN